MMLDKSYISSLRQESRKLIRELGLLYLNQPSRGQTSSHWHALIEIEKAPGLTVKEVANLLLLSPSMSSRIVESLIEKELISSTEGIDKREKSLTITSKGLDEIKQIDAFSHTRIIGALDRLTSHDHQSILESLKMYGDSLEKSRLEREKIKIHTLSSSRPLRKQIIHMIETIQVNEYALPITPDINACILKTEETFSCGNKCNFWYATNDTGLIIGSIGLKKINDSTAEVKKFFVHQNFRGKGTAHKLMKKMVQTAQKNGFQNLYLGTVSLLKSAQSYYEKVGFKQISKSELPPEFEICPLDSVFFKGNLSKLESYFKEL